MFDLCLICTGEKIMVEIVKALDENIDECMNVRLEMLRIVNGMGGDEEFD